MCGILGEYSFKGPLLNKKDFKNILSLSENRGPDHTGIYNNKNIQLGFNRLKIIDLTDAGNQPIISQDNRFAMVYNGEVYNYKEIKKKLQSYNINFRGNGDTEVIVNAFSIFGLNKTIDMLDGMFAIALYDNKKNKLTLIRDFAGIKPLHYAYDKNTLFFASQYNQVVSHPSFIKRSINEEVLKLYINQHYISAPFGLLYDTYQVSPGEIVQFNKNGNFIKKKYWVLPKYKRTSINDINEAESILYDSLKKSIKSELVSDVPIGTFLSGGIDSPLISVLANELHKEPLKSVTIGSKSTKHDETDFANFYAKKIGLNHIIKKMDSVDALNIFDELAASITEPFADISLFPTFLASKISKRYFNVALSGDGGDELFFGYERFRSIAKNYKIQSLPYFIKYLIYGIDKILNNNQNYNSNSLFYLSSKAHFNLHSRFPSDLSGKLFKDLKNIRIPSSYKIFDYQNTDSLPRLYQYIRYSEFYGMMQKTLKKIDLASMHNSIEVRVPFLKKELIYDSLKFNPYLNIKNKGNQKYKILLKNLLIKKIPGSPIEKPKKGFSIPLTLWMKNELFDHFSTVLMDKSLCEEFGVNRIEIELMLNDHKKGKHDFKWPIFTIFSLFVWRKNLLN